MITGDMHALVATAERARSARDLGVDAAVELSPTAVIARGADLALGDTEQGDALLAALRAATCSRATRSRWSR